MKRRERRGFSLVEVLVGAGLLAVIAASLFLILRTGSRASLKGMTRLETTMEGHRLLQWLQTDLKQACIANAYNGDTAYSFANLVTIDRGPTQTTFSWAAFPRAGSDREAIIDQGTGRAPRLASRITYTLDKSSQNMFWTLTREERFHPKHPEALRHPEGTIKHVLSRRVNAFDLTVCGAKEYGIDMWWIYFQLGDTPGSPSNSANMRKEDVLLADFFSVATSDYFKCQVNNPRVNPNWHTTIEAP